MNRLFHQHQPRFFHRLLSVSLFLIILLSLTIPGSVYAVPEGVRFIIVFKDTVNPVAEAHGVANAYGLQTGFIYQHALKGMSALVPAGRLECPAERSTCGICGRRHAAKH